MAQLAKSFKNTKRFVPLGLTVLGIFLLVCWMAGGASRGDILSQTVVRLAAVAVLAICLVDLELADLRRVSVPLALLFTLGGMALLQLIPLPPGLWDQLPGRAVYAEVAQISGTGDVWRPLSLTPDLTWNSFLSILPPAAALFALAKLRHPSDHALLCLMIIIGLASGTLGILQLASGGEGPLYLYRVTNHGYPVGVFANRNHQAVLLAMSIPMLAVWATLPKPRPRHGIDQRWMALAGILYLTPLILIAGSRSGLILATLSIVPAWLITRGRWSLDARGKTGRGRMVWLAPLALFVSLIAIVFYLARAESVQRIMAVDNTADQRYNYFLPMMKMIEDFFPTGVGLGAFDPVFRSYEPDQWLHRQYFNHAHNDFIEIGIEAGLPGLILLVVALIWLARKTRSAWRSNPDSPSEAVYARLASVLIWMLAAASIVDYPLRTPLLAVMGAICVYWLSKSKDRYGAGGRNEDRADMRARPAP